MPHFYSHLKTFKTINKEFTREDLEVYLVLMSEMANRLMQMDPLLAGLMTSTIHSVLDEMEPSDAETVLNLAKYLKTGYQKETEAN